MAEAQLTDTAIEGLRTKLDQVVSRMVADGQDDATIRAVVEDFKSRHFPAPEAEGPSMLDLAGTAIGRTAKNLVTAPINLARSVGTAAMEGMEQGGAMGAGMNVARRMIVDPAIAQGRQVIEAGKEGRYSEAFGHGLASVLPVVGPAAANIGESLGSGDPTTMAEGVGDLASMAVAPAVIRGTGRMVRRAGEAVQSGGRSAFLRAAKIPESVSKRTNAYRRTQDLGAGEREIANTVLARGRGAITARNVRGIQKDSAAAGTRIGELVDNAPATIPARRVLGAIDREIGQMKREAAPAGQIQQAIGRRAEMQARAGGGLGSREAQTIKSSAYDRNQARYGSEAVPPGIARADMAMARGIKQSQEQLIPGLREANRTASELRPAARAMSKAGQRVGHNDPVGLTQAILGAGGAATLGPAGALMALLPWLQRGGSLSRIGQGMYDAGGSAQSVGSLLSQTPNQAALLSQILAQQEQP